MTTHDTLRIASFRANGDVIKHINALLPDHTPKILVSTDNNSRNSYSATSVWLYTNDDAAARQNYSVEVRSLTPHGETTPTLCTILACPTPLPECAASVTIPTTATAGMTRDLLAGLFDLVNTSAALFPTYETR